MLEGSCCPIMPIIEDKFSRRSRHPEQTERPAPVSEVRMESEGPEAPQVMDESGGFDLETDIDGRSGVGQRANGDEVDTGVGIFPDIAKVDAPGSLGNDRRSGWMSPDDADGLANQLRSHIVEKKYIGPRGERFVDLGDGRDLDLDLVKVAAGLAGPFDRLNHSAGEGEMVVLDQHSIIESKPMIGPAANRHGVLFEQA